MGWRRFIDTHGKNMSQNGRGVGEVTFLQNHYRVLHVAVHEVNPEVGKYACFPFADLHWAPYGSGRSREGHPVYTGIRWL